MSDSETMIQKRTEGFAERTAERSAELAAIAVAASAKAEVESSYVMALKKPRNAEDARIAILNICKNPVFAEKAIYKKPVGGQTIEGPSIRFAEESLRHWTNVKTIQTCIFEDEIKRIVKLTVIDLEANLSYSKEITIEKTIERRDSRGREVVRQRINSSGKTVFIVRATEDELQNKEAALASKVIRNNGLRLIPEHIIEEAMETAKAAMKDRVNKDPESEKRKVLDAFAQLGIKPSDLEKYLKHKIDQVTPSEILDLRQVFSALKDGQARWSDYIPEEPKPDMMPSPKAEPDPTPEPSTTEVKPSPEPHGKKASKPLVQTLQKLVKASGKDDGWLLDRCSGRELSDLTENECKDICNELAKEIDGKK